MSDIVSTLNEMYTDYKQRRQETERMMYANQAFSEMAKVERLYDQEVALKAAIDALKEGFNV